MHTDQLLQFLTQLNQNNNKPWMDAHKADYQAVRKNLLAITDELIQKMAKLDGSLTYLKPADCIFRINRDIRFSKDKTPYKNNMGIYLAQGGKKGNHAGYYLHFQPNNQSFIAGGLYEPTPDILKNVRQEIDYNGADLEAIVSTKKFKALFGSLQGETLQRVPKGYDTSHPYNEWLKLKSFLATHPLTDEMVRQPNFIDYMLQIFEELFPLTQFFNQVIGTTVR